MAQEKKLKIEYKKTDDLIPYVNNSRVHTITQINQVAASIKEFGFINPVVVDKDNGIVAGHCRIEAAKKLDMEQVPTISVEYLTPIQVKALIIADNKLAENSEFDNNILELELRGLMEEGFETEVLGFDSEELNKILSIDDEPITEEEEKEIVDNVEYMVVCEFEDELTQQQFFEEMEQREIQCKIMS